MPNWIHNWIKSLCKQVKAAVSFLCPVCVSLSWDHVLSAAEVDQPSGQQPRWAPQEQGDSGRGGPGGHGLCHQHPAAGKTQQHVQRLSWHGGSEQKLLFNNKPEEYPACGAPDLDLSDHYPAVCIRNVKQKKSDSQNFKHFNEWPFLHDRYLS